MTDYMLDPPSAPECFYHPGHEQGACEFCDEERRARVAERVESLRADLEEIERHRRIIIGGFERLRADRAAALRTLARLERLLSSPRAQALLATPVVH